MTIPEIAEKARFRVDVGAGRTYWWYACGRSKHPPVCHGTRNSL